jgi:hypothetical protein
MESRHRVVAGLAVAAVALIVAGVAAVAIDSGVSSRRTSDTGTAPSGSGPIAIGTPSPSVSVGTPPVSPAPTPSDVPSPTAPRPTGPHKPGFAELGDSIVYFAADGTTVPVQQVPGLQATLAGDRVIYAALAGNPYGLRAGAYAGDFMPNVSMARADGSSAETGGIVLVGPVVTHLIADTLAAIEAPADRWIVALPVDIRGTTKPVDVSFDDFGLGGQIGVPRVAILYSGSLPVVDVIPANAGYHVLVEQLGTAAWQVIDPTRLTLSSTKLDPDHLMNELLIYGDGATDIDRDLLVDKRAAIGHRMLSATGEVSVSLAVRGSHAELGPSKVLAFSDVPVFVASS